jgi:hypothetical protein
LLSGGPFDIIGKTAFRVEPKLPAATWIEISGAIIRNRLKPVLSIQPQGLSKAGWPTRQNVGRNFDTDKKLQIPTAFRRALWEGTLFDFHFFVKTFGELQPP